MDLFELGSSSSVPVTAFRLLAGLKPMNGCLSVLDLSFCRLDNLVVADPNMKVHKDFILHFYITPREILYSIYW